MRSLMNVTCCFLISTFAFSALAEQTVEEKAEAVAKKAKNEAKRAYRNAKGELCEMMNGKLKCVAEKTSDKVESAAEGAKQKMEEAKDKVD